jgi:hypothetical protein
MLGASLALNHRRLGWGGLGRDCSTVSTLQLALRIHLTQVASDRDFADPQCVTQTGHCDMSVSLKLFQD